MSDYLANLVARTLRPSFAIRPRLQSSFGASSWSAVPDELELGSRSAETAPAIANDFEVPETRTTEPTLGATEGSIRRAVAPRQGDRLIDAERKPSDLGATFVPPDPPIATPKSETVQSVPIFDEIAVRAKVSSPVRTIIPSKQESTSVPDASLSTRRRIPFSLEHSFEKRSVQNPQPADPASAPDLDSVVTEGGTDREPVQAGGIAAQITARRAGRKPPPDDPAQTRRSDRRFAASNVVAPEPTIQVTIGRVEVRATAASPVIRPPRAAPQTMSLEDYLRRRAGGTSHE